MAGSDDPGDPTYWTTEQADASTALTAMEAVESGVVQTEATVEEIGEETATIARSASFAEVATRPKDTAIDDEKRLSEYEFYERLLKLDGELAGTVRASSQLAAMGIDVVHPSAEGAQVEIEEIERTLVQDCRQLLTDLGLAKHAQSYFHNLITHGDDVDQILYDESGERGAGGVVGLKTLPLRDLTIVDDEIKTASNTADLSGRTIVDADWYALNEDPPAESYTDDAETQYIPAHDILHMAVNNRRNWKEDKHERQTFGIWGRRPLEPVKWAVQAKSNTLTNKVAMDDKLLAREVYTVNVADLFGHIENDTVRQQKVDNYVDKLREKLNDLDADQKPILPEEVQMEIKGPDGKNAQDMVEFIGLMNNSIQHALNFHVAGFGGDAGGTERGNRPAKEMSENHTRHLRGLFQAAFRKVFEIHAILRYPQVRAERDEFDADRFDGRAPALARYQLKDEITLPHVTFEPVNQASEAERVKNASMAYEKGIAGLNEARHMLGLDPVEEGEIESLNLFRPPGSGDKRDQGTDGPSGSTGDDEPRSNTDGEGA